MSIIKEKDLFIKLWLFFIKSKKITRKVDTAITFSKSLINSLPSLSSAKFANCLIKSTEANKNMQIKIVVLEILIFKIF